PLVSGFSGPRFVVIAGERRRDLLIRAMQAGVRHFLVKGQVARELLPTLQRITAVPAARLNAHGSVVTVLGAGGGCGATTFAINLAHELGRSAGEPSLVIDLDTRYGAVASCLGVECQFGIADVLHDGERIDSNLLRSTAHTHGPHLHVLVSPVSVSFDSPKPVQTEHLARALVRCREAYANTIIDAPR